MTLAWIRAIALFVAVPQVVTGAWAVLAPRHWFETFPGVGPALPAADPPFNQHLVTDAGAGFLAVGVLLALTAVWGRPDALTLVLAGQLVFTVPHLIYHAAHPSQLLGGTADALNVVVLSAEALLCALLVILIRLEPRVPTAQDLESPSRARQGTPQPR